MKKIILLLLFPIIFTGCDMPIPISVPEGNSSATREISDVQKIEIADATKLNLQQGDTESLKIIADEDAIQNARVEMAGNTLSLGRNNTYMNDKPITYNVTIINIDDLHVSGASDAEIGKFQAGNFSLEVSGASSLKLNALQGDNLSLSISGASNIEVGGKVENQDLLISGASSYESRRLESSNVKVEGSGASDVVIWATENLEVELSGASNLQYIGTPKIQQELSGSSKVSNL